MEYSQPEHDSRCTCGKCAALEKAEARVRELTDSEAVWRSTAFGYEEKVREFEAERAGLRTDLAFERHESKHQRETVLALEETVKRQQRAWSREVAQIKAAAADGTGLRERVEAVRQRVADNVPLFSAQTDEARRINTILIRIENWLQAALASAQPAAHSVKHALKRGEPLHCSCGWAFDGKVTVTLPGASPDWAVEEAKQKAVAGQDTEDRVYMAPPKMRPPRKDESFAEYLAATEDERKGAPRGGFDPSWPADPKAVEETLAQIDREGRAAPPFKSDERAGAERVCPSCGCGAFVKNDLGNWFCRECPYWEQTPGAGR